MDPEQNEDLSGIEDFDLGALMGDIGVESPEGETPSNEAAAEDAAPAAEAVEEEELPTGPSRDDRLAEVLDRLAAKIDAPKPTGTPAEPTAQQKKDFAFAIAEAQLPKELLGRLMSEDPAERTQGLLVLLSGALNMARQRWRTEVQEEYQPGFTQLVQEHYAQEIANRERAQDFATSFPTVAKHPEGRLIASTLSERAVKKMQEAGIPQAQLTYGPVFKKYFAAELAKITTGKTPAAKGGKPAASASERAARQVSRGGAPAAERPGGKTLGDMILDVVS